MTESTPPRKRRSYKFDREAAVQVVIAFGTLVVAGALVGLIVPFPYAIPTIFVAWLVLMVFVSLLRKPRRQDATHVNMDTKGENHA